jgi:Kelch motif
MISKKQLKMSVIRLGLVFGFIFQTGNSLADKLTEQVDQSTVKSPLNLFSAVANNAVALAEVDGDNHLFSFAGLGPKKTYDAVMSKAFSVNMVTGESKPIASLPDNRGRLASIAATVNNRIYLFGGYTVAADHSEVSTPEVYRYDPDIDSYELVSKMPTPVDDSVALVYKNRYIYLVSGWHNTNNVDLVQVFDTKNNQWFSATNYPGNPVFGHAAGIVGNQLLVADGVKVVARVNGKNQYAASEQNWLGEIDPSNPALIQWQAIPKHPYPALYRMAAVGVPKKNLILFAGGSDNPYNFNGIGYDGNPSKPSDKVFGYNLETSQWQGFQPLEFPSMDHRGLLFDGQQFYIAGGMTKTQEVTGKIQSFMLSKPLTIKEK